MSKSLLLSKLFSLLVVSTLLISSCKKDDHIGGGGQNLEDPEIFDSESLSKFLYIEGAERHEGDIPSPSGSDFGAYFELINDEVSFSSKLGFELEIEADNTAKVVFIKILDSDEYFEIVINSEGAIISKSGDNIDRFSVCGFPPCSLVMGEANGVISATFTAEVVVQTFQPPTTQTGEPDFNYLGDILYWSPEEKMQINVFSDDYVDDGGNGNNGDNGNGTIDDFGCDGVVNNVYIDSRNGKSYNVVQIGNVCWFAENLNYSTGNSWCYDNDASNCDEYGRLYDLETALTACPLGWRLPSDSEWYSMEIIVDSTIGTLFGTNQGWRGTDGGEKLKGTYGWNEEGNGTDAFGFKGLPGGNLNSGGDFVGIGNSTRWWSSTVWYNAAYIRELSYSSKRIFRQLTVEESGLYIRCVRE